MDSNTLTRPVEAAEPPRPQTDHEAFMRSCAIQHALLQAHNISYLLGWITEARAITEAVALCASVDAALKERLDHHQLAYRGATWEEQHSQALSSLVSIQQDLLTEARSEVH